MAKYQKLVRWTFASTRFSADVKGWLDEFSAAEIADIVGVTRATIINWANGNWTERFEWPHMVNFLAVCEALDLDPRDYFVQEDC